MKIAFLTAGGIAPCLSASIGALIQRYNDTAPDAELIGYLNGVQRPAYWRVYNISKHRQRGVFYSI